jgi:hypothetical protein
MSAERSRFLERSRTTTAWARVAERGRRTPPPDVAGGDEDETERYEQESAGGVRSHLSSVHHSRGDRHARVGGTLVEGARGE